MSVENDPAPSLTPPPSQSKMTEVQLRLEREKLGLEREMIALERERMAAERVQWRTERELLGQATSGLHVGMGVFGLSVATALVVAGVVGFNAGTEAGRHQAPLPRHVVVGRQFLDLLARTQPLPAAGAVSSTSAAESFDALALYRRPKDAGAAGNLVITK